MVDRSGTRVSLTNTLLSRFGAKVALPQSGIIMNNGMMWFDPRPGSANAIAPGARPLCNMCPVVVTPKDGSWPRQAMGSSGGRRILASIYQTLAWQLDFGMGTEATAHQPRIDVSGPDSASADLRLPVETLAALEAAGPTAIVEHSVLPVSYTHLDVYKRQRLPNLGGLDISPIILLLIIFFIQSVIVRYIYPNVF